MTAFADHYALLEDDDIVRLSADIASLVPEARQPLKLELERRGLSTTGINWDAPPTTHPVDTKKTIPMQRIIVVALAAILILLMGPRAFAIAFGFAKERYFALSVGFAAEAVVNIATGILFLMHHKTAIYFAGVSAVLLTLDALVGGLTLLGILQVALAWWGFFWYRSLRIQVDDPTPVAHE